MRKVLGLFVALSLCAVAFVARAHWDETYPYTKWVQMPDPLGWDVWVENPKILADDFLCTSSAPITDIHFWVSWADDYVGVIDQIDLGIWTNCPDPDGEGPCYSQPGTQLWDLSLLPAQFDVEWWGEGDQGWYDPDTEDYWVNNHDDIYLVNVFLDPSQYFDQEGTPEAPVVYWLSVSAHVTDGDLGWKTSLDHWEDDAVWSDGPGCWEELRDPITGESLDLAFAITTIPEPSVFILAGFGLLALLRRRK